MFTNNEQNKLATDFEQVAGDRVFFAYNSSAISAESKATIARQAEWLNSNKNHNITVEGHCDERGTREYNIALGERRADAVKKSLVAHDVSTDRIDTISYGKERPAVVGHDQESFSKNRRGVIVLK